MSITNTYQLMVKFNFFTEELNPTKYICELWNEHFNVQAVGSIIDLDILETQALLQKNRKYLQRQDGDDLDYDWETQLEMDDWDFYISRACQENCVNGYVRISRLEPVCQIVWQTDLPLKPNF